MKPYDVSSLPYMINIGYCGENHWRPIPTDCAALLKDHPNGIVTLWVQPNGESEAFPVELNHGDGDVYIWTPLAEEMTAAAGKMQYMCTDGTDIGKSSVVKFYANGSIIPGAEHPAGMPSWAAEMITRERLDVAQNGTYTAPAGKAYTPVVVAVPNSYSAADEGKVVQNGALITQGSQTVTQNGTVDTTAISSVTVNVQGGGGTDLAAADVYVADYLSAADLTIALGAVNRYQRYIVGG